MCRGGLCSDSCACDALILCGDDHAVGVTMETDDIMHYSMPCILHVHYSLYNNATVCSLSATLCGLRNSQYSWMHAFQIVDHCTKLYVKKIHLLLILVFILAKHASLLSIEVWDKQKQPSYHFYMISLTRVC